MITRREINRILKRENLVFKKNIRTSDRFVLILAREGEKDFVLKILRNPRKKFAKIALKKEAAALELFSGLFNSPQIFGANFEGRFPYYKEEFINGKTLEQKKGFFFKKLVKSDVKKLSNILLFLNKIDTGLIRKKISNFSDFGSAYFDFGLKFHQKEIKKFLKKEQRIKFSYLIKKVKEYSVSDNNSVVHGEVYPNNLMKNDKGEIILLDWENIGIGNPGHDVASVYLRLRARFLSDFLFQNLSFSKEKNFKLFFTAEIILQSLGSLSYFEENKKKFSKKTLNEIQGYFLNKINSFLR